jgi:uncharacterized membrane protein YjfL (UPF0719 family)
MRRTRELNGIEPGGQSVLANDDWWTRQLIERSRNYWWMIETVRVSFFIIPFVVPYLQEQNIYISTELAVRLAVIGVLVGGSSWHVLSSYSLVCHKWSVISVHIWSSLGSVSLIVFFWY